MGCSAPPTEYPVPDPPYGLVASDFDGDGFPDVATANIRDAWEGTISIFMNDGTGILGAPSTIRSAFSTEVSPIGQFLAEDADLDGDRDLLLMSYGGQDLLVYENDGQGGFALQGRYVVGAAPSDFRCLDFTGDGKPDIGAVIGLPPANLNKRFVVAGGIQTDPAAVDEAGTRSPSALVSQGPNPFTDFARVGFRLPARTPVRLAAYDVAGREVASLLDGVLGAGEHLVTWDGTDRSGARLAAGVYLMRLITDRGDSLPEARRDALSSAWVREARERILRRIPGDARPRLAGIEPTANGPRGPARSPSRPHESGKVKPAPDPHHSP